MKLRQLAKQLADLLKRAKSSRSGRACQQRVFTAAVASSIALTLPRGFPTLRRSHVVHVIHPRTGDCLFIPSGRIHAIGAGLLIYEIQQNSDTTYRVFDWNRVGLDGKPRQLHIAESLASIDFADFEPSMQSRAAEGPLVSCEFFDVHLGSQDPQLGCEGQNLTLAVTQGHLEFAGETFRAGDFAIMPSSMEDAARQITSRSVDAQWLEIRIPA